MNNISEECIIISGEELEDVDKFTYLGSIVSKTGGTEEDISNRISKARYAFYLLNQIWRSGNISRKTKLRLFNSNVKSVLLYGSETWSLTKKNETKIQVFVNKCLRRILKVFWPQIISNQDLWSETNQPPIVNQIQQRKMRWIGHTLRKSPDEITRQALKWNPQGKRKRGRPKMTWRRQTIKEIENSGLSWNQAEVLAQDRGMWRGFVDGLCPARI